MLHSSHFECSSYFMSSIFITIIIILSFSVSFAFLFPYLMFFSFKFYSHIISISCLICYLRLYIKPTSLISYFYPSTIPFPMVSLEYFSDIILPVAPWPWDRLSL